MWLLKTEVLQAMREARRLGYEPTAHERREFAVAVHEAYAKDTKAGPRNLRVAGQTAQIDVDGVLTEKPDCFALLFGGGNTTYASIREALAAADADPNVESIVLNVSSPGGHVTGLFETLAALQSTKKPISSIASLAASAAYAIVAVAGPVRPTTPASQFGSIGVAASIGLDEDVIDIASTEAPNKRPDVTTDEGRAVVIEELDAIHAIFADAIASGRSASTGKEISVEQVNSDFGRGSVLLAGEAKKRGMIDALPPQQSRARKPSQAAAAEFDSETTADSGDPEKETSMSLTKEQLKTQHPELFAAVAADAVALERDRVGAHLTAGEASGDMKTAIAAVRNGDAMTQTLMSQYMMAGLNRNDRATRQQETDTAGKAADGAQTVAAGSEHVAGDLGDQVWAAFSGKKAS